MATLTEVRNRCNWRLLDPESTGKAAMAYQGHHIDLWGVDGGELPPDEVKLWEEHVMPESITHSRLK